MSAPGSAAGAPGARLRRGLSSFDVLLLTLSSLSPVGSTFGFGSDVVQHAGTGAVMLFLVGIGMALIWASVYGELGSAYPCAGADYVGVGAILGPWSGAVVLAVWVALNGPAIAFTCSITANYVGYLAPGVAPLTVEYGSLAVALGIALLTVRTSAIVTGIFLALEMVAVLAISVAGEWHPARGILEMLAAPRMATESGALVPVPWGVLALGAVGATYACIGGNQAIFFGEELVEPHRRMGRVVVVAALIGALATALPVICVLQGAGDLGATLRSATPFADVAATVLGPGAARALSAAVALATFNCAIVQIMLGGRLFYSLARDSIFGPRTDRVLVRVHETTGVPRAATFLMGAQAALCCLLDSHTLAVFLGGTTCFLLALVSLAVIVGRRRRQTGQIGYWRAPAHPLAPIAGLLAAAGLFAAAMADPDVGRPSLIVLLALLALALAWYRWVLARRPGGWAPRVLDSG